MTLKTHKLRDAISLALVAGVASVAATGAAFAQESQEGSQATTLDRIEVTGSRIKRAEIEGALPVTVIDRTQLEASGDVSVADFLRDTNFNSFGSYQSSSGSSWGGFTGISLRGLGEGRTLILVDGRRAATSPMHGSAQDLNSIPMAAVERIEILSDGASAVYGSDALGGVVNIITRKDFEGVEMTYGLGFPDKAGGDTEEMSVIIGTSGDRGRILAGASRANRDVIFTRDRDFWAESNMGSTFSNNLFVPGIGLDDDGNFDDFYFTTGAKNRLTDPKYGLSNTALPGTGCTAENFYVSGGLCQFNHGQTSAKMTGITTKSAFFRGDYQVSDDWLAYFNATVTKMDSFGRYAPVPSSPWPGYGAIEIKADSPNHPGNPDGFYTGDHTPYQIYDENVVDADGNPVMLPFFLTHRFASAGNRDGRVENTVSDYTLGFEGRVGEVDIDFGARYAESRAFDMGQNYVVAGLAQAAIDSGAYNLYTPYDNDPDVIKGFSATILRDLKTSTKELFASAGFDLFDLAGGTAAMVVGTEYREEFYQDNYDPLSEAGQIVGSAGNSASGDREIYSGYFEVLLPFFDGFEVDIAGRYDDYSDYGSDFAPKISARWHPIDSLTIRGSYGEGFKAPSLDLLSAKPSFSASYVTHEPTCLAQGLKASCETQINEWRIANPNLQSEQSEQFGLGVVWDTTDWLNMSLDYYNIEITNQIAFIGTGTINNCLEGTGTLCPGGLQTFPQGTGFPDASLGLGIIYGPSGEIISSQAGYTNIGMIETQGYDFSARTRFDFGEWGRLNQSLTATYVSEYSTNGGASISGRPGYPRIRAGLANVWNVGDFAVTWNVNYVHGTQSQAFRQYRAGLNDYGLSHHLPSWTTHDIQVKYDTPWNGSIALGVRNAFDREAVIDPYYSDFDSYIYNTWGRTPYFRYTQRF